MGKARVSPHLTSPHPASLRPSFSFHAVFFLHAARFRRASPCPSVQVSSACTPRVSGGFSLFPSVRGASAFHTLPAGRPFAVPFRLCVSYHMLRPVGIPPVSIVIFGARFDRRGSGKREKRVVFRFFGLWFSALPGVHVQGGPESGGTGRTEAEMPRDSRNRGIRRGTCPFMALSFSLFLYPVLYRCRRSPAVSVPEGVPIFGCYAAEPRCFAYWRNIQKRVGIKRLPEEMMQPNLGGLTG